jgi:N-acetylglutamate synthase-like GNAT family acetyltransferase
MLQSSSTRVRKAFPKDMDDIYLMGKDAWGKGELDPEYLVSCRSSSKYKEGEWFLLEDEKYGAISSLIVYGLSKDTAGIGSIATTPEKRGNGCAARLIEHVVGELDRRGMKAVFLFSDIAPRYYGRFGFAALPAEYQQHAGSVCMIRAPSMQAFLKDPGFRLPDYF